MVDRSEVVERGSEFGALVSVLPSQLDRLTVEVFRLVGSSLNIRQQRQMPEGGDDFCRGGGVWIRRARGWFLGQQAQGPAVKRLRLGITRLLREQIRQLDDHRQEFAMTRAEHPIQNAQ